MPTDIAYIEGLQPYQSERRVEVYGNDKQQRLAELPRDVQAFEQALTSVMEQINAGQFFVPR